MKLYCPYGCGAITQGQRCVCGARPVRYVPRSLFDFKDKEKFEDGKLVKAEVIS